MVRVTCAKVLGESFEKENIVHVMASDRALNLSTETRESQPHGCRYRQVDGFWVRG